jgi:hypothetical protein
MLVDTVERKVEDVAVTVRARRRPRLRLYPPADIREFIPDDQWAIFQPAIRAAHRLGIDFAIGGGLAISFYTGRWRNSKDLDIYVSPADRAAMIEALTAAGLTDYYDEAPYDRNWIYRAQRDGVIVDLIWAMANRAGEVDRNWLRLGAATVMRGEEVRLLAPEEMFWSKLHVVQRDRCDWPDLLNLLYTAGPAFDWRRLLTRLRQHDSENPVTSQAPEPYRLLASLLLLFAWVAPGRAAALPRWLWSELGLPAASANASQRDEARIRLLDSRPWFTEADVD